MEVRLRRQQNQGYVTVTQIVLDPPAKFDTVHPWHHDITDNQVDEILFQQFQRLDAVLGREHRIAFRQLPPDEGAHLGIVLDDQNAVSLPTEIATLVDNALGILLRNNLPGTLRRLSAERECQHEHIQFPIGAHRQRTVVQFGQRTRQRQSDARSRRFVLAGMAEKRGEDSLTHLRRHDLAVVGHRDPEGVVQHRQFDADHRFRIFQGIVQQVAQNLGEGFAVDLRIGLHTAQIQFKGFVLLLGRRAEPVESLFDEVRDVLPGQVERQMLLLDLLEIQQLVRKVEQTVGIAIHDDQILGHVPVHRLLGEDVLQRSFDQRQRRTDLMRDIGEKADLGVVKLPLLFALESLYVLLLTTDVAAGVVKPDQHEHTQCEQPVDDIGRHGEIERRRNLNEKPLLDSRIRIAGTGREPDPEAVFTIGDFRIGDRGVPGRVLPPLVIEALEFIEQAVGLLLAVAQGGDLQHQRVLVVFQADRIRIDDALAQRRVPGPDDDLFVEQREIRDVDRRHIISLAAQKRLGIEGNQPFDTAEIDGSVRRLVARLVIELVAQQAVGHGVDPPDTARPGIERCQPPVGRDPEAALIVLDDLENDIAGHPVESPVTDEGVPDRIEAAEARTFGSEPYLPVAVLENARDIIIGQ